ncbi:MAG: hypothetical protein PVF91_10090 [Chromatiales bacterium]
MARLSKDKGGNSPPLYEVRELTLEEALLVLAADKEERRIRAEEKATRAAKRPSPGRRGGRGGR